MNLRVLTPAALLLALAPLASGADRLEAGFRNPPAAARPWVYWFPLDGNLSSNGITADLEAMRRVGIGGVLYMETDQGAPRGPAGFAGPLWRSLFQHICSEAHRLGIEVNMNNDAGWCGSGGPWITPELSMQRVVWAETNVAGPVQFNAVLPQAPAVAGYYRDIAVFAFPTPATPYRVPHLPGKSAQVREEIPLRAAYPAVPAGAVVPGNRVLDITRYCAPDGRLAWAVPAGPWTILRLGHTSTGKDNHPAPVDGRGLECDKLSRAGAEAMFAGLMGRLIAENRPLAGTNKTLVSTHIDSWEVGSQNWTPLFREEFLKRRGYDPFRYLVTMAGYVIESPEITERFLWDIRMTVNDLLLDNYAGHFRTLARRHGLRLSIEAYDGVPAEDMAYAGRADEPMGEWWSYAPYSGAPWCTEMASAAHIYGKPILGAEAFTATDAEKWQAHPGSIKAMGDWAFCEGINRFVFHRYALQPWTHPDRPPGMSMGPWGLHYERTQTWWEQSRAWHEYLARCQFLLQQGRFVADLCFLEPENAPQKFKSPVKSGLERPGYNFDGCTPEAVLTRMAVRNSRIVLPDGMSYAVLVLPRTPTMTPTLLRKIADLVRAGATVVGAPPVKSPSLANYPRCDVEVKELAAQLWGDAPPPATLTERRFGRGRVFWGGDFGPDPVAADEPEPLQRARWIWRDEGDPVHATAPGTRYFRRVFVLGAATNIASARLTLTADNSFEAWLNGKPAGAGDQFNRTYSIDVASALRPGTNLLAVAAVNATDTPNPAGLIAALHIRFNGGDTFDLLSDATWQASAAAPARWPNDPGPDPAWAAARDLGPLGMAPWGEPDQGLASRDPIPDIVPVNRLLADMGVRPDFASRTATATNTLRYIHKRIGETDLYFVANKNPQPELALCTFRIANRRPELWWPDTGRIERPATYDSRDGLVHIPIRFDPSGSVFVVFRPGARTESDRITTVARNDTPMLDTAPDAPLPVATEAGAAVPDLVRDSRGALRALARQPGVYTLRTASGRTRRFEVAALPEAQDLAGPWTVQFDPKWGGPARVVFESLQDWAKRPEDGIRFYSGTATYHKTFTASAPVGTARQRWFLDLGKVAVMAEVRLNGRDLGILWKPPFRLDVTDALRPGQNQLELRVVNLWINRQIGDEQLPEDSDRNPNGTLKSWPQWLTEGKPSPAGRYTFTSWRLWKKDAPLSESGLLGPVRLEPAADLAVGR